MDVLDLPVEKQQQLASQMGFDNVEAWREHIRNILMVCAEESARVDAAGDLLDTMSPEEQRHARKKFGQPVGFLPVKDDKD